ncbi:MAG: outer membrane protein assembly factor BamA [Candidatus Methylacidiphilales bacterium]|nr:outer membrane protein assembly factor BamA [Candidatus Methylacidiphilales bacterium]
MAFRESFHLSLLAALLAVLAIGTLSAQEGTPEDASGGRPRKLVSSAAGMQSQGRGPIVKEIEVEYAGPKVISKSLILANMRTTVGQPYSPGAVEEDIRNLYATGRFVNLRISDEPLADGVKVVVIVQPKALVKEIIVEGASLINEKRVRKEIKSKIGDPLSEQQVVVDSDKIREMYQTKGFDQVQVSYKTDVNQEYGRAVVKFTINEGAKAYVSEVNFIGNKNIAAAELRKQLKTKRKDWLSIVNKSGLYKDDQFKEDLKKLRDFYFSKGFIDMQIRDIKLDYPTGDKLVVTITIFEGIPYYVGKVGYEGNQVFTTEQIREKCVLTDGKVYSPQNLAKDQKAIQDLYGKMGYVDAKVSPERLPNVESGKMDLVFVITEGPQSYLEKIIIQGNNRTKDKVLRRELALAPGDVYDTVRTDASQKRLEGLGFFEKVDINARDTAVPNRKNMVITVQEKRTGSINFGIGLSSVDSVLGFVELTQGNFDITNWPQFTGAGQKFRARVQYGLSRKDLLLSFTEPWFLNQRLSLGVDVFGNDAQYLSSDYDQRRYGMSVKVQRAITQFLFASAKYQLESIELYNFDDSVSPTLKAEEGARTKSSISLALTYDSRDNLMLTRRGERVELSAEFAGGPLFGSTDIYKFQIDAQKYFLLPYDMILTTAIATGGVSGYDDTANVPLFDRYFLGGSRTVRGFDNREISPRDSTGTAIGGNTFGNATIELTFPIINQVRGAVFTDAGFVDARSFHYADMIEDLQVAVGVGLRMNLPIGPVRLDFGVPLKADKYNESSGKFSFDAGYQF